MSLHHLRDIDRGSLLLLAMVIVAVGAGFEPAQPVKTGRLAVSCNTIMRSHLVLEESRVIETRAISSITPLDFKSSLPPWRYSPCCSGRGEGSRTPYLLYIRQMHLPLVLRPIFVYFASLLQVFLCSLQYCDHFVKLEKGILQAFLATDR